MQIRIYLLYAVFTVVMSLVYSVAHAQGVRALVVGVGDSTMAGYLAHTSAAKSQAETVARTDIKQMGTWLPAPSTNDIYVGQDSGSYGAPKFPYWALQLATSVNENKQTLSWALGSQINSHYTRIARYLKQSHSPMIVEALNVAYSGAVAAGLERELRQILTAWRSGRYDSIEYLALAIGPNDVCQLNSNRDFAYYLENFFIGLADNVQQKKPIKVFVVSSPRIMDFSFHFSHLLPSGMTCKERILKIDHYCNDITDWQNPTQYRISSDELARKNRMFEEVIRWVRYQYPEKFEIAYSETPSRWRVPVESLAEDCFHLNEQGQMDAAEILWHDHPWFK